MGGRVADQATCVAHAVHDLVAPVDAGRATDALVLQALADVDARGTHLHADPAIDAGAEAQRRGIRALGAGPARLAAFGVVRDDHRVLVEHRALEACIGAHVLADLLAHPAGVAVGGEAVEEDPEGFPRAGGERSHLGEEVADRREIADEGEPGPQPDGDPHGVLGGLQPELARVERRGVEFHALVAVALDDLLNPQEDLGIDGLRARVSAPEPAGHGGEEEQRQRGDDEQRGQVDEVLRPEDEAEDVELAMDEIEEHGLAAVPLHPGDAVEHQLRGPDEGPAPRREPPLHGAGVDLGADFVKRLLDRIRRRREADAARIDRPSAAHPFASFITWRVARRWLKLRASRCIR